MLATHARRGGDDDAVMTRCPLPVRAACRLSVVVDVGAMARCRVACPRQIIEPIVQRRVGRRQTPAVSAALCELIHNNLRSSGTE
jgi:hypothetical protein